MRTSVIEESTFRPAVIRFLGMDGVRGVFMVLFMAFHFGIEALTGAWVAVNVFFVLSAYLIVSLLLREHSETGAIRAIKFYARRARRLLPALFSVLLFVGIYAVATQNAADRRQTGGDIFASIFFVQNWRLIARADDYFGDSASPSMLRHLWTLAVEEQFYLAIPLLLTVLIALRSRKVAIVTFLALVAASVWRSASVGVLTVQDQAHAYYGTDTRLQAFALGAALAVWIPLGAPLPRRLSENAVRVAGTVGLILTLMGIAFLEPMSIFVFEQGGMVLVNLAAAALVLSVARVTNRGPAQWFSYPTLVWLGRRSYGLYIWHWPVVLVLKWQFPSLPFWTIVFLGAALTVVIAGLSFRWLEQPVIKGGFGALLPSRMVSRMVSIVGVILVVALASALWRTPIAIAEVDPKDIPALLPHDDSYVPRDQPVRLGLVGDSVARGLAMFFPEDRYPDIELIDLTIPGCDVTNLTPAGFNEAPIAPYEGCAEMIDDLAKHVQEREIDIVMMLTFPTAALPHFDNQGTLIEASDHNYLEMLNERYEALLRNSVKGGAGNLVLVSFPCRYDSDAALPEEILKFIEEHPGVDVAISDPVELNQRFAEWASARDVPVLDLYGALDCSDGYRSSIHGVELYADLMHFTPEATVMIWSWLAPRVRDLALGGSSPAISNER